MILVVSLASVFPYGGVLSGAGVTVLLEVVAPVEGNGSYALDIPQNPWQGERPPGRVGAILWVNRLVADAEL